MLEAPGEHGGDGLDGVELGDTAVGGAELVPGDTVAPMSGTRMTWAAVVGFVLLVIGLGLDAGQRATDNACAAGLTDVQRCDVANIISGGAFALASIGTIILATVIVLTVIEFCRRR